MKSKISFFNRTVFRKNCKLFGPISLLYFLMLTYLLPIKILSEFSKSIKNLQGVTSGILMSEFYDILEGSLELRSHSILCFGMAIILAMGLFNYMFNAKSAFMIHSLPVTRKELFGTNVISGLIFMWIPQLLTFVVTMCTLIINNYTDIKFLGYWLISVMAMSLLAYAMAVFCAMFTGQLFALPVYFLVMNFLYVGIRVIILSTIDLFIVGTSIGWRNAISFDWLSPFYYILTNVRFSLGRDEMGLITGVTWGQSFVIARYSIFAIILLIIAYVLYKRRPIERAGDFLAVELIKPIFRWGVGLCGGLLGGLVIVEMFFGIKSVKSVRMHFLLAIIIGLICFFIAEMFIQKSFLILKKKIVFESLFFAATCLVLIGVFYTTARRITNWRPEPDNILAAYVTVDYPIEFTGNDIQTVIDLQENIIDNYDELTCSDEYDSYYITMKYVMKDGHFRQRSYSIPRCKKGKELIGGFIREYESDETVLLKYYMGDNYDNAVDLINQVVINYSDEESFAHEYSFLDDEAKQLAEAILCDFKEGNFLYSYMDNDIRKEDYGIDDFATISLSGSVYYDMIIEYPDSYSDIMLRESGLSFREFMNPNDYNWLSDNLAVIYGSSKDYYYDKRTDSFYVRRVIELNKKCVHTIDFLNSYGLNIF